MSWTETKTTSAANEASRLSDFLTLDEFEPRALRYLTDRHVNKFFKAIDEEEAAKIVGLISESQSVPMKPKATVFEILDWLRVVGPSYEWQRKDLDVSSSAGAGSKLIIRLAEFQPEWVGKWWKWRCSARRSLRVSTTHSETYVIDGLSLNDFKKAQSALADSEIAAIVGRRPEFASSVPTERSGAIASCALDQSLKVSGLVEVLSQHGVPSDAAPIIDPILNLGKKDDILSILNSLVTNWRGVPASDPVTLATLKNNRALDALMRSRWSEVVKPSTARNDEKLWQDDLGWRISEALQAVVRAAPHRFRLELGFSIGIRLANREVEASAKSIEEEFKQLSFVPTNKVVEVLLPMVRLWTTLRTLARYEKDSWKHNAELTGLRAKTMTLAAETPELWAESLAWILSRLSTLGDVAEAVTLQLSLSDSRVRAALDDACRHELETVRLKAQGLWALLHGVEGPETSLARALADAAARYLDGRPIFPHPLTPVAATWLGALGLEQAISNGVRRALVHFSEEVREQGGNIEEALTEGLVKEIEFEFRALQPRLKLLGPAQSSNPILTVRQRPSSKKLEEPEYGCDLAWILNANVSGQYQSAWADLVQVKKSTALYKLGGPAHTDAWVIKNDQLDQILKWSATATYWLIAAAGEVLVVPAKHLLALKNGVEKRALAQTFTIGYNDVRSAAIPLEQYLLDLLIGQWIGTTAEDTLKFARGETANIRPLVVLEITISVGSERQ